MSIAASLRPLAKLKPDVAFKRAAWAVRRGRHYAGHLEMLRIPYTHSGVLASALAMRKDRAKELFRAAGIPVAEGVTVERSVAAKSHVLPPPYVIKPVDEGSSVGVLIVREGANAPPQELTNKDWPCGGEVLVERFVAGRELTCAVIGEKAYDVIEIRGADGGWYDYKQNTPKEAPFTSFRQILKENIYQMFKQLAFVAHKTLGCRGVSRTDFGMTTRPAERGARVLEVNTQPGMTETSLVPELAAFAGLQFGELVRWMVEDASCDR